MSKVIRFIESLSDLVSGHFTGWVIVLMMMLVVIEAISRYLFDHAFGVSDEFSAYAVVVISFVGLAYVSKKRAHIRVTVVFNRVPIKIQRWLELIAAVLFLIAKKRRWDVLLAR